MRVLAAVGLALATMGVAAGDFERTPYSMIHAQAVLDATRLSALVSLSPKVDALTNLAEPNAANTLRAEANLATSLCASPDLLSNSALYKSAREAIITSLTRAERQYAFDMTPIDVYRGGYRSCALRLGKTPAF